MGLIERTEAILCDTNFEYHVAVSSRGRTAAFGFDGRPIGPVLPHKGYICTVGALFEGTPLAVLTGAGAKVLSLVNVQTGEQVWKQRFSSEIVGLAKCSPQTFVIKHANQVSREMDLDGQVVASIRSCYSVAVDTPSNRAVVVVRSAGNAEHTLELRESLAGPSIASYPLAQLNTSRELFTLSRIVFQVLGQEQLWSMSSDGRVEWKSPLGEGFCLALWIHRASGELRALRRLDPTSEGHRRGEQSVFSLATISLKNGLTTSSIAVDRRDVGTEPVLSGEALLSVTGALLSAKTGRSNRLSWAWDTL